tara:strand:+ start:84 stop:317 length:234 start_codon:yes stop_codon:yes gene_type:complete
MKYVYAIIIGFFISLMIFGCDIEGKIDDASDKCENKISELLEGIEDICLTKEEILDLVRSIEDDDGADACSEEGPQS